VLTTSRIQDAKVASEYGVEPERQAANFLRHWTYVIVFLISVLLAIISFIQSNGLTLIDIYKKMLKGKSYLNRFLSTHFFVRVVKL
jgi:hypothetical protein